VLEIANNVAERRWEARLDGDLAGYAEYGASPTRIVFTHTVVEPEFEGRGIGSALAKTALDAALAAGQRIVPYCPFISAYLRRHHEYDESVDWPKTPTGA
jgi:predicted GNAT family acetyltransferase